MDYNKSTTLTVNERKTRAIGSLVAVVVAFTFIWLRLRPQDWIDFQNALWTVPATHIGIAVLYGIFAIWCTAHLDVIADHAFGGRIGRPSALRLGIASRAFGHCGCWSKSLRHRTWRLMQLGHKSTRLRAIVRISNGAYVMGLYCWLLIGNVVFPEFLSARVGLDPDFVSFLFLLLIIGSLILVVQRQTTLLLERATAMLMVGLYQVAAAITIYVLVRDVLQTTFGEILVAVVFASSIGWALRVPFTLGVLEVMVLFLAGPDQLGATLAALAIFHLCFQGPAFLISLWISFAPSSAVPLLLGAKALAVSHKRSRNEYQSIASTKAG